MHRFAGLKKQDSGGGGGNSFKLSSHSLDLADCGGSRSRLSSTRFLAALSTQRRRKLFLLFYYVRCGSYFADWKLDFSSQS